MANPFRQRTLLEQVRLNNPHRDWFSITVSTFMWLVLAVILGFVVYAFWAIGNGESFGGNMEFDTTSSSWGINGVVESRCIEGYKYIVGDSGHRYGGNTVTQVLDKDGHGVPCK